MTDAPPPGSEAGAASLPTEPSARAVAVVEQALAVLEVEGEVRLSEDEEEITIAVESEDDPALLIGKHGATIDALQHLASRIAFRGPERDRKRVVVDAGGYRGRRQVALERAAERAAADALSFGRAVELDPMNAFERRIVHTHLKDRPDVETHSEGDEPDRRLVVTPSGPSSLAR
jgi:spoIIIJ-associated protein